MAKQAAPKPGTPTDPKATPAPTTFPAATQQMIEEAARQAAAAKAAAAAGTPPPAPDPAGAGQQVVVPDNLPAGGSAPFTPPTDPNATPPTDPATPPADPAATPPVDPASPGAPSTPEVKKPEDFGGTPLTPEEQARADQLIAESEADTAQLQKIDEWKKGVTPETEVWMANRYKDYCERVAVNPQGTPTVPDPNAPAPADGTTPPPASANAAVLHDAEYGELKLTAAMQTVNEHSFAGRPIVPQYVNMDSLRERYGIDPNKVPKEMAEGMSRLINDLNRNVVNGDFFYREGKKAFESRDAMKDQMLKYEWKQAVQDSGVPYTTTHDALFDKARPLMFDPATGAKVAFPEVVAQVSKQYPDAFPAPAQAGGQAPAASTQPITPSAPATTSPQGTTHQATPPGNDKPELKTMAQGSEGFAEALRMRSKST